LKETDAAELIGIGLWVFVGVAALWMLVTGRKIVFGLPRDYREGWPVRVFGLAELLLGLFFAIWGYLASRGAAPTHSLVWVFAPLGFAVVLLVLLIRGKQPKVKPTGALPPQV
jgi:predicted membrane metal-binding protein